MILLRSVAGKLWGTRFIWINVLMLEFIEN
jgi:hypothetical protein